MPCPLDCRSMPSNHLSATADILTEKAAQEEIFSVWKTEPDRVPSIRGLNKNRGYRNGTP
jgi:hypothetical protein